MAQVVQYCRSGHQLNLEIEVRLGTILFGGAPYLVVEWKDGTRCMHSKCQVRELRRAEIVKAEVGAPALTYAPHSMRLGSGPR